MKWNFHKHFEVIEEFIKTLSEKMRDHCDPERALWGFWMSSTLPKAKIPEALLCVAAEKFIEDGWFYHLVFTNHPKTAHI